MKMKRKCAASTLVVLATVLFLNATSANAVTTVNFSDVPEAYPYSEAVEYLKDSGVVEGYGDGTYKPENTINRAEFVKIIILSGDEAPEGANCFPDVKDEWYAGYVCKAKSLGLVEGYPDGDFKPERPINFVEAGKIVSEGLSLEVDESLTDEWYHGYVDSLESENAIPPSVATFDEYISRGEMAEMIWRIKTGQTLTTGNYSDLKEETQNLLVHEITSCEELKNKFEESGSNYYGYEGMMLETEMAAPTDSATADRTQEVKTGGDYGNEAEEFSTTNVQVEGVDEADIVKTDGEFIYIVKGDSVRVVKAYPPADMMEMSAVTFDDDNFRPRDMYVDGDKLIILGSSYYMYPYPVRDSAETAIYPYYGGQISKVYIMDTSDKENITEFRSLEFEGNYNQSRKVGDMVYVVLNRFTFWAYPEVESTEEIIPRFKEGDDETAVPLCDCDDVKYVPAFDQNNYLILAGIPIDDAEAEVKKEVVLGSSDNIYASLEHMYAASTNWSNSESTSVYKFNMSPESVEFLSKGNVPGTILNQFSMDEYDDHFRIATTKGNSWDNTSANNVYVLDNGMNMTGKLENIAPGESIYSTRFMGDRLYMVTFKKIDPFFVIDMADHKFPKILGKLKIPGYSDYLHPYDENHILGFGKETVEPTEWEEENWGGFDFEWFQGMKVALFDVTDVENPVEKFKIVIGDRGTESPLLYDHKALLFDRARNLLAFPVKIAELSEEAKDPDDPQNIYGDYVFQGAHVYNVDLENGFDLQAQISHYDEDEVAMKSGSYWFGEKDIERVLYLDDYLYTVSKGMVKANDMNTDYEDVNSVEVGGESDMYHIME
jgi:uncharacterized secreted protein with C-terminal beta-propeller domain